MGSEMCIRDRVLADEFPQFLTDVDQTLQGHSIGHGKCLGELLSHVAQSEPEP